MKWIRWQRPEKGKGITAWHKLTDSGKALCKAKPLANGAETRTERPVDGHICRSCDSLRVR